MNSYKKMVSVLGPKRPIMTTPSVGGLKMKGVFNLQRPGVTVLSRYHIDERYVSGVRFVSVPENGLEMVLSRSVRPVGGGSSARALKLEHIDVGHELYELFQKREQMRPLMIDFRVVLSNDCMINYLTDDEEHKFAIAVATRIREHLNSVDVDRRQSRTA